MVKVYSLIVLVIVSFSESSPQDVDIHRIGVAISRLLTELENADPSKFCHNDTDCRMSEKCILSICRNPCRTECGVGAVCNVKNHEPICRCPKCYEGDALIKCTPYEGRKEWTCLWDKLLEKFNAKVAHTSKET